MAFISNLGNTGNTANNFVNNNNNNMQTVATTVAPTRSSPLHLQDGQCVSPRTIQHLHPIIAQMQNPATAQLVYQQLLNSAIAAQSQLLQNAHSSLLHTVSQHHQQQQQRQSHHSDILANVGVAQVLMTAHDAFPSSFQLQTLAHLLNPLVYYQQLASLIQQQQQHQQQQPQPQQQQSSNTIAPRKNIDDIGQPFYFLGYFLGYTFHLVVTWE
ncbi:unnamed protein product [Dracunculus medinensis]|uniref:Polyhomeotic-like protein 3 n=1 Tax=Dracunculus medinensis TaxID=318479 RepID=A0A158Q5L2_DRAME|nr:unnamed protein product [Dracunculus medinensis]